MERAARCASFVPAGGRRIIDSARVGLIESFERLANDVPMDPAFRDVEVVNVTSRKRRGGFDLILAIDKPGGVDMATCERLSRRINNALEAFPESYTLSVESVGLERPLLRPADYERFIGAKVKVITTLAIGGAKTHRGKLMGVRGANVLLAQDRGELPIPLPLIKNANIEYDIRDDLTRDKKERRRKI